jgi:hypothetical protein
MLSVCSEPGCTTLVFGDGVCLAHETRRVRKFVRGRPYWHPIAANRRLRLEMLVGDGSASKRPPASLLTGPLAR